MSLKRAALLTGCLACEKLSMAWVHRDGRWRGACPCGASTRAAPLDAAELDRRAGVGRP